MISRGAPPKFTSHKGSWGDGYLIENTNIPIKVSCSKCMYYNEDKSCNKKPVYIPEIGYNFWKYCSEFKIDPAYDNEYTQKQIAKYKREVSQTPVLPQDLESKEISIPNKEIAAEEVHADTSDVEQENIPEKADKSNNKNSMSNNRRGKKKKESIEYSPIIDDVYFDTNSIWSNIVLIGLSKQLSLSDILFQIEHDMSKDCKINGISPHSNLPALERSIVLLKMLASKLECHISELFNTDKEWIKDRTYSLLEKILNCNTKDDFFSCDIELLENEEEYASFELIGRYNCLCFDRCIEADTNDYIYGITFDIQDSIYLPGSSYGKLSEYRNIKEKYMYAAIEFYYEKEGKLQKYFEETLSHLI